MAGRSVRTAPERSAERRGRREQVVRNLALGPRAHHPTKVIPRYAGAAGTGKQNPQANAAWLYIAQTKEPTKRAIVLQSGATVDLLFLPYS